ncbi:MAG: hypothetical protein ABI402_06340 [Ferruginibacter sp.]
MPWNKKGLIYNVNGAFEWNKSHAQVPVIDVLHDRLRIYYATRNAAGKSNISFIETDRKDPAKILFENNKLLFEPGHLGTFDDSGLMPSSIISVNKKKYLYYIGWTTRQTVPYQNAVGLAIGKDGTSFNKFSEGPIITVNHIEPYFSGTSFVMFDEGIYKMWYLSCIGWETIETQVEPLYNIKYAESNDGINWIQTGKVAIELIGNEGGLVSASVIKEHGIYKMWFGKRKKAGYRENIVNGYRIGYAESGDGINWVRKDEQAGIDISADGWDSAMISYPYVVKIDDTLIMFYNGNGFGKSGIGYATWQD